MRACVLAAQCLDEVGALAHRGWVNPDPLGGAFDPNSERLSAIFGRWSWWTPVVAGIAVLVVSWVGCYIVTIVLEQSLVRRRHELAEDGQLACVIKNIRIFRDLAGRGPMTFRHRATVLAYHVGPFVCLVAVGELLVWLAHM